MLALLGGFHEIKLIDTVGDKFKENLNLLNSTLSEKLADACKVEQKTCVELTDIKETVDHMIEQIDRVTNDQVWQSYPCRILLIRSESCAGHIFCTSNPYG